MTPWSQLRVKWPWKDNKLKMQHQIRGTCEWPSCTARGMPSSLHLQGALPESLRGALLPRPSGHRNSVCSLTQLTEQPSARPYSHRDSLIRGTTSFPISPHTPPWAPRGCAPIAYANPGLRISLFPSIFHRALWCGLGCYVVFMTTHFSVEILSFPFIDVVILNILKWCFSLFFRFSYRIYF